MAKVGLCGAVDDGGARREVVGVCAGGGRGRGTKNVYRNEERNACPKRNALSPYRMDEKREMGREWTAENNGGGREELSNRRRNSHELHYWSKKRIALDEKPVRIKGSCVVVWGRRGGDLPLTGDDILK